MWKADRAQSANSGSFFGKNSSNAVASIAGEECVGKLEPFFYVGGHP